MTEALTDRLFSTVEALRRILDEISPKQMDAIIANEEYEDLMDRLRKQLGRTRQLCDEMDIRRHAFIHTARKEKRVSVFLSSTVADAGMRMEAAALFTDRAAAANRQKRETIIDALRVLDHPTSPAIASKFIFAFYGDTVAATQFAAIRKGDERLYARGRRFRTFLVPCISAETHGPYPGTIALSEWPLEKRIVGSHSERRNLLDVIARCIEIQRTHDRVDLKPLYESLARSFRLHIGGTLSEERILFFVKSELLKVSVKDYAERMKAARDMAGMPEADKLFGASS